MHSVTRTPAPPFPLLLHTQKKKVSGGFPVTYQTSVAGKTANLFLQCKNFRYVKTEKGSPIYHIHNLALGVYLLIEEGEGEDVGEPVP
jgi:hypothetical protein